MQHRPFLSTLLLLAVLQGCGPAFVTGSQGSVSVGVQGDARAAAAVGALATGVALAGAAAAAQPPNATVSVGGEVNVAGTATAPQSTGAAVGSRVVVSQITGLTVHAAGTTGRAQPITGGAIALELPGNLVVSDIVGGDLEIDAAAVEGAACTVNSGTVRLANGTTLPVHGGRVTLARNPGGQWIVASGRITTTETTTTTTTTTTNVATATGTGGSGVGSGVGVGIATAGGTAGGGSTTTTTTTTTRTTTATGVVATGRVEGVDVGRVAACGGVHVIAGGEITLTGAPAAEGGLTVLDGAVDFDDAELSPPAAPSGRAARVTVRAASGRTLRVRAGGTLLVGDRRGRRWRVRVEGGALVARTDGTNPSGRVVWQPTGGELRVSVLASGGENLTLDSAGLPEATVDFSPRVRASLDALVRAVAPGTREAERMAAAVEVVVREAESAEPAFYAIPVRGRALVLMVDISYSMSDPDPRGASLAGTPAKLDVARAELVKVLASVPAGVTVNVLAFSSTVHTLWTAPRVVDDASLAEAIRWVAALRPADETHPLEAIDAAAAMHPDQIVMLSDGRPSDSDAVLRSLLARVDTLSATCRVDVVGFGADQDRAFLGTLATHGHGTLRLR